MTQAAYAARVGVTPKAIRDARRTGRVVTFEDGSIDAEASDERMARMTDPSKQRGARAKAVREQAKVRVGDGEGDDTLELPASADFLEVKTFHERRKVEKLELEIAKRRGELVERAAAEAMVFAMARQERDSWLAFPARVSATMAAELGVDTRALEAALERHVREHLAGLGQVDASLAGKEA